MLMLCRCSPKIAALALAACIGSVHAITTTVTLLPSASVAGLYTATAQAPGFGTAGFDTFNFEAPVDGSFSFVADALPPVATSLPTFTGYEFFGTPVVFLPGGAIHLEGGPFLITAGPHTLGIGTPGRSPEPVVTGGYMVTFALQAIPEPATWILLLCGLLALAWRRAAIQGARSERVTIS
jgi:PEP-CTERM motif